jgi:hypothetical protein
MASLNACHRFTSLRVHQVTSTHLLHIDGYSAADQMVQKGECIDSRTFSARRPQVAAALLPQWLRKQIRGRTTGYDDIKYMAEPDTAVVRSK